METKKAAHDRHGAMMSPMLAKVKSRLKEPHGAQAAKIRTADDDMIVKRDPELCRRRGNVARDRDILPARFGAAARMIVDHAFKYHKTLIIME